MKAKSIVARAPCSTANIGPGYDVFGLALDALYDTVAITREGGGPRVSIAMLGDDGQIPVAPESNSAGRVVGRMLQDFGISDALSLKVRKGVPAGYGMGSSAASSAAAALAFKALYGLDISDDSLVEYAAEGEIASAGTKHYDNVSASLLGGFVITAELKGSRSFIRLEPPADLRAVVAVPLSMPVPKRKTEVARSVLPKQVPLRDVVSNVSSASTLVAGIALKDVELFARGVQDAIVEPARKSLIPGYDQVKENALSAGALAVTISGAGPSMIAFLKTARNANKVADAMSKGFESVGIKAKTVISAPSKGARLA